MKNSFFGPIYDDWRRWAIPSVSIALYALTVALTIWAQFAGGIFFKTVMVTVAGAWAVVVPAAFSFEHWSLGRRPPSKQPNVEGFKYAQQLARNTWIAALAFLAVLHTNILPKNDAGLTPLLVSDSPLLATYEPAYR